MALLEVRNLRTVFATRQGVLPAVDDVSFHIEPGETLALVGESGCGKSVTAASILRLVPDPPGRIVGLRLAMIVQEPMTSLNPLLTIGDQITEVILRHEPVSAATANQRAIELLNLVRIPDATRMMREYPHRLSGGMRQRAMIAMALSCKPALLIADEPTTALDVTTQAQILELLDELKERLGMAVLLITHDLGVVAHSAQRVIIMYAGRVVEEATVTQLFERPMHPYTRGLLGSLPRPDREMEDDGRPPPLPEIPGMVPSLADLPPGCRFAPRCASAVPACELTDPRLDLVTPGRSVACPRARDLEGLP